MNFDADDLMLEAIEYMKTARGKQVLDTPLGVLLGLGLLVLSNEIEIKTPLQVADDGKGAPRD